MGNGDSPKDGQVYVAVALWGLLFATVLTSLIIAVGTYCRLGPEKHGPGWDNAVAAFGYYAAGAIIPVAVVAVAYHVRKDKKSRDRPTVFRGVVCLLLAIVWSLVSTFCIGHAVFRLDYAEVRKPEVTANSTEHEKLDRAEELLEIRPPVKTPIEPALSQKSLPDIVSNWCTMLGGLLAVALCLDLYNVSSREFYKKPAKSD
jgi:hypothetical protein